MGADLEGLAEKASFHRTQLKDIHLCDLRH